jgi:ribonuclease HII
MKKAEREIFLKEKLLEMKAYERSLCKTDVHYIAGIDEAGRGPLAGPVVAAAVILPNDCLILGINDSKKLSAKKRETLFDEICETAIAYGIASVDNTVIDEINILEATKLAMKEALNSASIALINRKGPDALIDHVLIDALSLPGLSAPQTGIIKGDEKSLSIAAASILAKVSRDRLMLGFHDLYPAYAFDQNKGYGTKLHYQGIEAEGLSPIHRRTFCKPYVNHFSQSTHLCDQ